MADKLKKRAANWTLPEKAFLIQEVRGFEKEITGKFQGCGAIKGRKKKEIAWQEIAGNLNAQLLNVERSAEECRKQYSNCKDKAKEKNDAIRRPKTGGGPKPPSPTLPEQMILDDHSESAVFFGVQNGYDTEEVIPTGDAPLSAQQQEVESANTAMLTSLPSDVVNVYVGEDGILGTSAKEGTYPRRKSCKRARGDVEAAEIATLLAEKEKFVEEKKYFQAKTALVQLQIKKLQAEMEGTSTAPVLS